MIGTAMNSINEQIIELYEAGELPIVTAKELIYAIRSGLDSVNSAESVKSFLHCRCGYCLQQVSENNNMYSLDNASISDRKRKKIMKKYLLVHNNLCRRCYSAILTSECGVMFGNVL